MTAAAADTPPQDRRLAATTPVLRTLVLADLVESTALTEQLGDVRAIEIFRKHDRVARDLVARHGGREIDKTDGFLVLFDRPIRAIAFALDYQRALRTLGRGEGVPLSARVGIHVGDVLVWENTAADVLQGAKPIEVEGLVKPIAARLMGLARPGQVLMTGVAHTLAQRGRDELGERAASVRFKYHGRYEFKGVAEALPVYEAGEDGVAPLKRPVGGDKARRERPWWFRPRALAAEVFALLAAVVMMLWFASHTEPAIAFAERDWVVVADLRNLTTEKSFDVALDTALRIGLEQSRYVNLVSDLQVRDALKRMTKPSGTPIDRSIGSEIAVREGARALIIPTVAEVGGRIRVSAEVVDPHTQTTVYAHSADGSGTASALGSVDKVTRDLRSRLGETLSTMENQNQPLEKVTTANLDALRAYSLGQRALADGRWTDALNLYHQALELDPDFALAQLAIARVHISGDDRVAAREDLRNAAQLRERLPARDALYLDALLAGFETPAKMLEKWKLLYTMYPDSYAAYGNYALFAWQYGNQFDAAIESVRHTLSDHNPMLAYAYHLLGTLHLAKNEYAQAITHLERAKKMQGASRSLVLTDAYAATRQFDRARATFAGMVASGVASNDLMAHYNEITLALDQGQWSDALEAAARATKEGERVGALYGRVFRGVELSLAALSNAPKSQAARLKAHLADLEPWARQEDDPDRDVALFNVALTGYLAARGGQTELARSAQKSVAGPIGASGFPLVKNMLAIAEAELARATGEPSTAVAKLRSGIDGAELYVAHVALRDALADAHELEAALAESDWLAEHRGRAYVEGSSLQLLQPLNVAESDLALLRGAELALALGRRDDAARRLAEFRRAWPEAERIAFVTGRVAALERRLKP